MLYQYVDMDVGNVVIYWMLDLAEGDKCRRKRSECIDNKVLDVEVLLAQETFSLNS